MASDGSWREVGPVFLCHVLFSACQPLLLHLSKNGAGEFPFTPTVRRAGRGPGGGLADADRRQLLPLVVESIKLCVSITMLRREGQSLSIGMFTSTESLKCGCSAVRGRCRRPPGCRYSVPAIMYTVVNLGTVYALL